MSGGANYMPGKPMPPHHHRGSPSPPRNSYANHHQQQQQQQQPLVVPASLGVVPPSALANVLAGQPPPPKRQRKERDALPGNNQGRGVARRWNAEEEAQLRKIVTEVGTGKWPTVAERLATGRTPSGVEQHWQIMTGQRKRNGKTTPKEAEVLPIGQRPAGTAAPGVPPMQDRGVPHRWTVDEEARLRALVQEIGKGKWALIADSLGTGRSASGVEQHWQIMIGQRKRNSSAKTPSKPVVPPPVGPALPGLPITAAPVAAVDLGGFESPVLVSASADNTTVDHVGRDRGPRSDQLPPSARGAEELTGNFVF